jgi:hypothetical protein
LPTTDAVTAQRASTNCPFHGGDRTTSDNDGKRSACATARAGGKSGSTRLGSGVGFREWEALVVPVPMQTSGDAQETTSGRPIELLEGAVGSGVQACPSQRSTRGAPYDPTEAGSPASPTATTSHRSAGHTLKHALCRGKAGGLRRPGHPVPLLAKEGGRRLRVCNRRLLPGSRRDAVIVGWARDPFWPKRSGGRISNVLERPSLAVPAFYDRVDNARQAQVRVRPDGCASNGRRA